MPILKNHRHIFLPVLTILVLLQSCRKQDTPPIGEITSFKIEAQRNSSLLDQDLVATISDKKIHISIPDGMDLDEVYVSYLFRGSEVYLNNQPITPEHRIQIKDSTVFRVKATDNRFFDYMVLLSKFEDVGLLFNSFLIEKISNPLLPGNIDFEIGKDTIYGTVHSSFHNLVPTFTSTAKSISVNGQVQQSGATGIALKKPVVYTLTSPRGFKKSYYLKIDWAYTIPHIFIETEGNAGIFTKETYVRANISIDGKMQYESYEGTTGIRGRGNSTWQYPKRPYRLKLDTKASLFGLSAEKDWVLLANYLDGTHMLNAVAMKCGQLLNIPFTNNIIHVELTINGAYQGLYMFTEQVEVETNRVNVGKDGVLLELDTSFDEDWKFISANYQLPVMVKYPDLESNDELDPIRAHFEQLESVMTDPAFPNNNYLDHIDGESIANFVIVNMLTGNAEINFPKSTYIHKTGSGKYTMGPLWDFDWAYDYNGYTDVYFTSYSTPLFWASQSPMPGTKFFMRFLSDPKVVAKLQQRWAYFKGSRVKELFDYIDQVANAIEDERDKDYQLWKRGGMDFRADVNKLKAWLQGRVTFMDSHIRGL